MGGLHAYGHIGYGHIGYGKRSAEPSYHGYGSAAVSVSQVDPGYGGGYLSAPAHYTYGYNIHGKRSADAFGYGGYGYGGYGHHGVAVIGHHGVAGSHQAVLRPTSQYHVNQAHPY